MLFKNYYKFDLIYKHYTVFTSDHNRAFDFSDEAEIYLSEGLKSGIVDILNGDEFTGEKLSPVTYDSETGRISISSNKTIIDIRGWGMLTGIGGYNLPNDKAVEIQDAFANYIVETLNNYFA